MDKTKQSNANNWYDGKNEKQLKEFIGNPQEYAILCLNKDGHVHIHAPFASVFIITKMLNAFIAEAEKNGVRYEKPTQNIIEE